MSLLNSIAITFIAFIVLSEGANQCYSGQNSHYAPKQCSTGGTTVDFTCQKFVCEGGHSPFTLRTCARKNMGCIAGPRICQFSGGHGQCQRCDGELSPFEARACSPPGGDCESSRKLCADNGGAGSCYICQGDDCNGASAATFGFFHGIAFAGISIAATLFVSKSML